MSIPAHDPLVWPAALTTPLGPAPQGVQQGLSPAINGPQSSDSTADFNAEGIVQKGYSINPFAGSLAETLIRAGDFVFCCRSAGTTVREPGSRTGGDLTPFTMLSLPMINMVLQDAYEEAMAAFSRHANTVRGLPQQPGYLDYLKRDEACWTELFAENGKLIQSHKVWKHFYHICKEGILRRWNPLGFSILPSAADVQTRGEFAYLALNIAVKGTRKYIANVWGENAGDASNLFLILKRRRDPMTGEYGAFAFHPYSCNVPQVPLSARAYIGISGGVEYGEVIPIGRVRNSRKMTLPPEKLAIIQGIAPDVNPALQNEIAKQTPVLDVAIHSGLCIVVACCG